MREKVGVVTSGPFIIDKPGEAEGGVEATPCGLWAARGQHVGSGWGQRGEGR